MLHLLPMSWQKWIADQLDGQAIFWTADRRGRVCIPRGEIVKRIRSPLELQTLVKRWLPSFKWFATYCYLASQHRFGYHAWTTTRHDNGHPLHEWRVAGYCTDEELRAALELRIRETDPGADITYV